MAYFSHGGDGEGGGTAGETGAAAGACGSGRWPTLLTPTLCRPTLRTRTCFPVTVAYDACATHFWLATTCPQTLIVSDPWDVLESGNEKENRVNLA